MSSWQYISTAMKKFEFKVSRLLSNFVVRWRLRMWPPGRLFWLWLRPRRRRQTRGGPQTSAMSFLRTASHHAMTTLRVWTKPERIDKDFNFRVVGEGKFFLYSGLFEQIYATEAESKLTTSELYNYKSILISRKMWATLEWHRHEREGREREPVSHTKTPLHAHKHDNETKCVSRNAAICG